MIFNMAVEYTNRKGQTYYLHSGTTKTGRRHYYMSMTSPAQPVDALTDGYEIWEEPSDAQVYVRKIKPTLVAPEELELVKKLARKLAKTPHVIVEVEKNDIVVYAGDADEESRFLDRLGAGDREAARRQLEQDQRYHRMFRFELLDGTRRNFSASRWCFLGSIDNWHMLMGGSGPLEELAARYLPHLGDESFFELM
jgi:hypothetical protein